MPCCCMQPDLQLLVDILAAADDVLAFSCALDLPAFTTQKATRYAILHSLTIIGEASGRLSENFREHHSEIPWRRIIAFRHRIVHGYGELDLELVWEVTVRLVPQLRVQVASIMEQISRI